jgi:iron complex outermembrane recepter protein
LHTSLAYSMKYQFTILLRFSQILLFIFPLFIGAQSKIKGVIKDSKSGEQLASATLIIKGTTEGTVADFDGKFELETKQKFPLTLVISYVGYIDQELVVNSEAQKIAISLVEEAITIGAVDVKGRRISEKQTQSPLTMETMDAIAITETPSVNFYDGLGALKDVDLTAASLGFKIINTRGFNSTSPVRSLQVIDGVDNQSPGLNFSLGNFLGASELDVNRVNLIVGASSSFYGPNAFNGVISIETKNPFIHKGLTVQLKGGSRDLIETGLRWSDAFKNKRGLDVVAMKFNLAYFRAYDWVANNYNQVYDTPSSTKNPGGYDAVNVYGDEYLTSNDFRQTFSLPGLGIIHRQGYREVDIVNYNSTNTKLAFATHIRLNPSKTFNSPELIVATNFSTGTTVYQGDNRFSLRDIKFFQHRLELKKQDKYFIRAYATHEDAGNSYDPYFTALKLQEKAKPGNLWLADYINYWQQSVNPKIQKIEGYPRILDFLGNPTGYQNAIGNFLSKPNVVDSLQVYHAGARLAAEKANTITNTVDFFQPGTQRYQDAFNEITSKISFAEDGTRFFDRSALYHTQGEYKFNDIYKGGKITDFDMQVGGSGRLYTPNSRGSILLDTNGRKISVYEYGIYGGGTLELDNRWKISATMRMDKNQNFNYLFSPAASLVYTPTNKETIRFSFSSAIRNPTLADQYLFYNVGRAILIGNLDGFNNLITVPSLRTYLNTREKTDLEYFSVAPIRPEQVKTLEIGYRNTLFNKLYIDATYYYSFYKNFIGYNLGVDATFNSVNGLPVNLQAYRVAANARDRVTTQGFSIGLTYYFATYFALGGNYSYNKLNTVSSDPIIPAFNTPLNKFNLSFSGRDIPLKIGGLLLPDFGFSINYKWIEGYLFTGSPQFTGLIPTYDLLDAQINWQAKKIHTTFKLGGSNLLNRLTYQVYGGPQIGRLLYLTFTYDLPFKKK